MMFELFTYGGGDNLRYVLNGVAKIFGNGNYFVAMEIAAMIGLLGIMITAAFQRGKLEFSWLLGIVFIFMAVVVPKTTVIITDRVVPANSAVVANIPLGIAVPSTLMSKVGDWLTRTFETNFSLPSQITYTGNGLLFANYLVEESTRFEVTSPRLAENLSDFWKSCVYYDILLNLYSWEDVLKANDLMKFFKERTSESRSFTYQDENRKRSIVGCRLGANGVLSSDLDKEIDQSTNINGARLVSGEKTRNAAVVKFSAAMPVAYKFLTGLSLSSQQIISQNVLSNSLRRGLVNFASSADAAAAAEDFALAKAEAERKTTFSLMGEVARRHLPKLKIIFEAFIYAIFPIIVLLAMLPAAGKVLIAFTKVILWVNLWPPLYAIMHFMMAYWSQADASQSVVHSGSFATGLTMMTNTALGRDLYQNAAIAGYLSMSIPLISWLIIQLSGTVMANVAGRVIGSMEGPISKGAEEATSGNISLGNTSIGNERSFQVNNAPNTQSGYISSRGDDGITTTETSSGSYYNAPVSTFGTSIDLGKMTTASARESFTQAVSNEQVTSAENLKANAQLRSEIDSTMEKLSSSEGSSQVFTESQRAALSEAQQRSDKILQQFADEKGISFDSVKKMSMDFMVSGGIGAKGVIGMVSPISGSIDGSIGEGSADRSMDQETYKQLQSVLSSEEYSRALQAEGAALHSASASYQDRISKEDETRFSNTLTQQENATERHSVALREMESASKSLEQAEIKIGRAHV